MNMRVGSDGALYIVDMYREIIEDYSAIPRYLQQQYGLDKGGDRGRIWRLAPETEPQRRTSDFSRFSDEQLVQAIGDASLWRRLTAQRLLIEQTRVSAVRALATQIDVKAAPHASIHALYALDGLGKLRASDIIRALEHEHYGVRLHALRLAKRWFNEDDTLSAKVFAMTDDADPGVRLQLTMTLGESSRAKAVETMLTLVREHGNERWMAAAILSSSNNHAGELLFGLLRQAKQDDNARLLRHGCRSSRRFRHAAGAGNHCGNGRSNRAALPGGICRRHFSR